MSWEMVKLGDIAVNLDNRRKPLNENERNKISKLKLYPYLGANNVMGYVDEYLFDEDIVCIAEDGGSWGKNEKCATYVSEKCWVNNHAHVLGYNGRADLKYIMYYLNQADLNSYVTGSTRGKLTKSALESIQIPLPPLPVQKRIAEILDAADALRRKDEELLKKYDELAQAIFIDMFGDPVRNEKGWEVKAIGEITKVGSGSTPNRQNPEYFDGGIPWVKTTEVNGRVIYSTEERITDEGLRNSSCKIFAKDSVIVAMYGQGKTRGQVGLLGIEAATNQACAVISPCDALNPTFLFNYLKLSYSQLRGLGRGGNQENLNKGMIEEFQIIVPSIVVQNEFNRRLNSVNLQRTLLEQKLTENLFNSMIRKAFKEELVERNIALA